MTDDELEAYVARSMKGERAAAVDETRLWDVVEALGTRWHEARRALAEMTELSRPRDVTCKLPEPAVDEPSDIRRGNEPICRACFDGLFFGRDEAERDEARAELATLRALASTVVDTGRRLCLPATECSEAHMDRLDALAAALEASK